MNAMETHKTNECNKEKRKAYMRNYMKNRNIRKRGQPRKPLTHEEKQEKIKINNRNNYMKNREKALAYARKNREIKTGITRLQRIQKMFNTLTIDEKKELKFE
jgi:hypothetical protein